jgi:2-haloacid dehalogenase
MPLDRRELLGLAAGVVLAAPAAAAAGEGIRKPRYKAVAFDAFPVFNPQPLWALAEELFPGRGAELSSAWRTRQFEYQWLRALSRRYADFWRTTEDALVFSATLLKLDLTPEKRSRLMDGYLQLKAWPEVPAALETLKRRGVRLAFLSNMTEKLLQAGITNCGLDGVFDAVVSTDRRRTYKPAPEAYLLGVEALGARREEILFAAFAGWDAAGAKSFGYPVFWVNRAGLPAEELGNASDGMGRDLNDLVRFVLAAPPE